MEFTVERTVIESQDPSEPAIGIQIVKLVDSYMVWIGKASDLDEPGQGNLCKDWAYAMPGESTATYLWRTGANDNALALAQRLAKRYSTAVFVSVDIDKVNVQVSL